MINKKFSKILNSRDAIVKKYGHDNGNRIARRLTDIQAATNLEELSRLPQTRVHELGKDRDEQISVDAKHPYRLLMISDHVETPRKPDGGFDWQRITKVKVIEIADTH